MKSSSGLSVYAIHPGLIQIKYKFIHDFVNNFLWILISIHLPWIFIFCTLSAAVSAIVDVNKIWYLSNPVQNGTNPEPQLVLTLFQLFPRFYYHRCTTLSQNAIITKPLFHWYRNSLHNYTHWNNVPLMYTFFPPFLFPNQTLRLSECEINCVLSSTLDS